MIKWFAYIVLLLIFAPCLSSALTNSKNHPAINKTLVASSYKVIYADTTKSAKQRQQEQDEKNKIKEIAKAKRQAIPARVDDGVPVTPPPKPKRQRRPEGMERPPEIPRHNGD